MERNPTVIDFSEYPEELQIYLWGAKIYDSSCSPFAKVIYIEKENGYYLKTAEKGSLKKEADMTAYFSSKGLSAEVLEYISGNRDYMLTAKIEGEDCIYHKYLEEPKKLCDTIAVLLRQLHETDAADCPVENHTENYFAVMEENYRQGMFDGSYLSDPVKHLDRDGAYEYIIQRKHLLKSDTLLHGDYCLPNIVLNDFKFSGFIDVGNGGVGDRHVDLFWGAWTLNYNLKTDKYRDRFFDAYGRNIIDEEIIQLVSVIETFG